MELTLEFIILNFSNEPALSKRVTIFVQLYQMLATSGTRSIWFQKLRVADDNEHFEDAGQPRATLRSDPGSEIWSRDQSAAIGSIRDLGDHWRK